MTTINPAHLRIYGRGLLNLTTIYINEKRNLYYRPYALFCFVQKR